MDKAMIESFSDWFYENVQPAVSAGGAALFDSSGYRELLSQADIRDGEAIVIAVPSGLAFLQAVISILQANAVPVFVPPGVSKARIESISAAIGARAVLSLKSNSITGNWSYSQGQLVLGVLDNPIQRYNSGELILTTSGTGGVSSGCLFSFDRLILNAQMHLDSVPTSSSDSLLACLPLSFSYAFVAQALAAFIVNARLFISAPPFSIGSFVRSIEDKQITSTSLTPYLVKRLANDNVVLPSCLRVLTVGGDTVSVPLIRWLINSRPNRELYITYGLTEAGPRVSTLATHTEPPTKWNTVGTSLRGIHTSIKGEGACGRLMVFTPTRMLRRVGVVEGYEVNSAINESGDIDTGDIFHYDANGYLVFVRRARDFVVVKGEKVCLSSVRRVANEHRLVDRAVTQVLMDGEEAKGYRLILHLKPSIRIDQVDTGSVLSQLRLAERPAELSLVQNGNGDGNGYK